MIPARNITARVVATFAAGDDVPSWLIDAEPVTPGGARPRMVFGIMCHVVETGGGYVVMPDSNYRTPQIKVWGSGGDNEVALFAPSLNVILPTHFMHWTAGG